MGFVLAVLRKQKIQNVCAKNLEIWSLMALRANVIADYIFQLSKG